MKNEFERPLHLRWLALMAWRDSRRNHSRLFLFVSSIVLGIAALVAIYSLSENMRQAIDEQAATLIGADLEITGNKPVTASIRGLVDSLGDRRSEERSFASMIYFTKSAGTRLVQVRALQGAFPYYGQLETSPASAGKSFREGRLALVDKTLMLQYNAKPGDSIKIGQLNFAIAGTLLKAPGQTGISASFAPAVYIPLKYMEQTGLTQKGSRINYKYYFKFDKPTDIQQLVQDIEPRLDKEGFNYDTIETQKQDTGRSFRDLTRFLSLVGFIALLLGCIGVASAIHIYVREKISAIAILRCLGLKTSEAFLIYLLQILGIALIGSVAGAALGTVVQQFLPIVLKDFLPVEINTGISWKAIAQGVALGVIISFLFALLPLVSIRSVSPLFTLRLSFEPKKPSNDPLRWFVYFLILLFIFTFSYFQLKNWREAAFFTAGILAAFFILTLMARLLMWMVRRFFPVSWSYLWRQGLANLYRPNNQTGILIVSIGLGTTFICTLFFIQAILLNRVTVSASGNQPNIVLFDIQSQQKDKLIALARQEGLVVRATVPVVNMRLERLNGHMAGQQRKDSTSDMYGGLFRREYRVTYRDSLIASEKITKGEWKGTVDSQAATVYISVEQRFATRFKINIGDTMTFNVQGSMVPTVVGSFRQVDWNRVQTNFLIVFPKGILEAAPQFHVLLTHVPSTEVSARFQQAVVLQFPNISIIDLALVLSVLDEILDKIGFVIRFMAAFSIITGIIVLIASVLISKYQRIQESVLLRTLGASRRQIFFITALEYFFLGALAAATGILLSLAGSWALAHYTFETVFTPRLMPVALLFIVICLLTVIIGLANSRLVLNKPPLEILRQE